MNRRKMLALMGGSLTAVVAGCSGDDGGDDETPAETPTEEPTDTPTPEPTDTPTPEPTETPTPEPTETPTETPTPEPEADATINVVSNEFQPNFLEVEAGATVEWAGQSGSHTVTFYHEENGRQQRVPAGVEALDAGLVAGDSAYFEFTEPGVYDYHCKPHEGQGMVGTIVVGDNDNPDQPGLTEVGGDIPDTAGQVLGDLNRQAKTTLGIPLEGAFQIDVVSNAFEPDFAEIPVDTTVQWIGQGGSHTVTFYHADNGRQQRVPADADALDQSINAEGTVEFEFTVPGVYDYHCQPHEGQGMVGSLVVGGNDDPEQPGLQTPGDDIPDTARQALETLNSQAFDALDIVTVESAATEANDTIDELNNDPDGSVGSVNDSLENVDSVPLIDPVEAETEEEATSEADRLRNEIGRVEEDLFTQVPKEINAQAQEQLGSDLVDEEEITDAKSARAAADEVEALNQDAADALRSTADIMDKVETELTRVAGLLDGAVAA